MSIVLSPVEKAALDTYWTSISQYPQMRPEVQIHRPSDGTLLVVTYVDTDGKLDSFEPVYEAEKLCSSRSGELGGGTLFRYESVARGCDGLRDERFGKLEPFQPRPISPLEDPEAMLRL